MTVRAAEAWVREPVRQFVADARVRVAVLMHTSGQVLAEAGLSRSTDVMSACALAAAINASAAELGRQLEGRPFADLHVTGKTHQMFLGLAPTRRGNLLLLCVFDGTTSLGLVQVFFDEFRTRIGASAPETEANAPRLSVNFEADLDRNLAALFGRT